MSDYQPPAKGTMSIAEYHAICVARNAPDHYHQGPRPDGVIEWPSYTQLTPSPRPVRRQSRMDQGLRKRGQRSE